jgi:two-component system cell cycle response regulator
MVVRGAAFLRSGGTERMTQRDVGVRTGQYDHICSGRNCMFCRVVLTPDRPKAVNGRVFSNDNVLEMVRKLEQRNLVANSDRGMEESTRTEEVERLALFDSLTDLYNSRTFLKELKDELRRAKRYKRPVSICMLTIDGFRELQNEYGTAAADLVLKVVSGIVQTTVRDVDVPARYSGAVIAIIFPETNGSAAIIAAERIRQRVMSQTISHNWQSFKVSASFGLSAFPTNSTSASDLVTKSLAALDIAKQQGAGQICSAVTQ